MQRGKAGMEVRCVDNNVVRFRFADESIVEFNYGNIPRSFSIGDEAIEYLKRKFKGASAGEDAKKACFVIATYLAALDPMPTHFEDVTDLMIEAIGIEAAVPAEEGQINYPGFADLPLEERKELIKLLFPSIDSTVYQ